jgi:two-component system nitrogen regulation sensor histidine kinase GlnL
VTTGRRRAGRLFRELLAAHPLPALAVSRALRLLWWNEAAEELFGPSLSRAAFRPLDSLRGAGPALAELSRRAAAEGLEAVCELELGGAPHRVRAVPLLRPRGLAGIALYPVRASRPEDLESVAAGLAHEIRNPLAGLRGAAELLRGELGGSPALREYADLIAREATRVDGLVRALLDLTRPPALRRAPVNLHAVTDDVLLVARTLARPGVRFERRFDPSLPEVAVDRDALAQVLLNLVKNAVEAIGEGPGTVAVETGVEPGRRVRDGDRMRALVRLAVVDDGPGLPPDLAPFAPFATTKPRGEGLGLAVSRRLVEAHGGRIELGPGRHGAGTAAVVLLPL